MKTKFRVHEAAELLGLHPAHLYRLIRDGQITPKGQHPLYFTKDALRQHIRSRYKSFDYLFPEAQ